MNHTLDILVIEDEPADYLLLERFLRQQGVTAHCLRVNSDAELEQALDESWDLVLSDFSVPGMDFARSLQRIKSCRPNLPVILVSGSIGEEAAVDLLNSGADDFVLKDNLLRLVPAMRRALQAAREHTARLDAEERLRLMAAVFNATQEGIAITDLVGRVIAVNNAFSHVTEYSEQEIVGRKLSLMASGRHTPDFYQGLWRDLHQVGFWQGEIWDRRKGGEIYPQWLTINTVYGDDGNPDKYVGIFTDITRIKHSTTHLEHLAHHDALTDLPNRLLLISRLQYQLERACRNATQGAVLFLDLDRFKAVNDTLGHQAGDELLRKLAVNMRSRLRDVDTLARIGGDEFVVVLEDVGAEEQAAQVAQAIIDIASLPYRLQGGVRVEVGCSIGICLFPRDGRDVDTLLDRADAALYQVKRSGRQAYRFFRVDET